ncbi:MAG: helix-turn-helix domain-containing protein [Thermomicrobiales bacterium]
MMKQTTTQAKHGDERRGRDLLRDAVPRPETKTDWARLEAMTGEEALQNALNDPDSQPLTPEQRSRLRRVPDPQKIRLGMGLTQEQFARQFEIALGTLRDWEQGVRIPDGTAKAYLRVIAEDPDGVVAALARSYPSR